MSVVRRELPTPLDRSMEPTRLELERELEAALARGDRLPSPVQLFAIVYGLVAPQHTRRLIRRALRSDWLATGGCVYVFRDRRDPADRVKIGMSTRCAGARLAEHRCELGDEPVLLVEVACTMPGLVERVAHTLLECAHEEQLVNTRTHRRATEYFRVSNVARLDLLLRALAASLS